MNQVRLLIVMDGFLVGGTETQILSMVPDLLQNDVHVVVVGKRGQLQQSFRETGCTVYNLDFPVEEQIHTFSWRNLEKALDGILISENINLIHSHQVTSARFVSKVAKKLHIPMLFSVHGTYFSITSLKSIFRDSLEIISVSPPLQDWLMESGVSSTLIPNGIATEQYRSVDKEQSRKNYGIPKDVPVVVYAGRIAWEKADICVQVINACRRLREEYYSDLRLVIAGSGPGYKTVQKHAREVQALQRRPFITLLGEQLDMNPVFSLADCVVGTGRVALEAMSCERPVIAAGTRGMVGLVKPSNYDLAIRYHFGDHKADRPITETALAIPIAVLLGSPGLRTELGTEGHRFVEENLNVHRIASQFVNMYLAKVNMVTN